MNGVDPLQRSPVDWHLPRGWIDGLILANDADDATNDIAIAEGVCRSTVNIVGGAASTKTKDQRDIDISEALIKQLDVAWAPGNGGGRSGSSLTNTTWHVYGIGGKGLKDSVIFHDSAVQSSVLAALPSGYTAYRNIMSVVRASAAIRTFTQHNDYCWWNTPVADLTNGAIGTTTALTLTVPSGIKVLALFNASVGTSAGSIGFHSPDQTGANVGFTSPPIGQVGSNGNETQSFVSCLTNASAQVQGRASTILSDASISTLGFIHPRGRNS